MNNRVFVKQLITESIEDENYYFTVNRIFNRFMDSLDGGVFLSQLVYWSDHAKRSDGFFYKTAKEWHDEIHISKHQIDKHTKKLSELGIVETKKIKANGSPTIHYKLDIDHLTLCLTSFLKKLEMEIENVENGNSNNSISNIKNSEMEIQKFKNGNQNNQKSILKISENEIKNIENGNLNNSISLTKITTENTQENTTEITTNEYNKDYHQEILTEKTTDDYSFNASSLSNSVDREKEEKKKEKTVVGRSLSRNEQIVSIEKAIKFTFDNVDEQVYKEIPGWLLYSDYDSIMTVLQETAQLEEIPNKLSSHILNMLIERKKQGPTAMSG